MGCDYEVRKIPEDVVEHIQKLPQSDLWVYVQIQRTKDRRLMSAFDTEIIQPNGPLTDVEVVVVEADDEHDVESDDDTNNDDDEQKKNEKKTKDDTSDDDSTSDEDDDKQNDNQSIKSEDNKNTTANNKRKRKNSRKAKSKKPTKKNWSAAGLRALLEKEPSGFGWSANWYPFMFFEF